MGISWILRKLKVSNWPAYVVLAGPLSWLGLIKAHVHPALALAFVVPFMPDKSSPKPDVDAFVSEDGEATTPLTRYQLLKRSASNIAHVFYDGPPQKAEASVQRASELLSHLHGGPL